jgi:hypothetical protein
MDYRIKNKTNGLKDQKRREIAPKEIPERNTSAGGWKLRGTSNGPGGNRRTCHCNFSQRQERTIGEKPA